MACSGTFRTRVLQAASGPLPRWPRRFGLCRFFLSDTVVLEQILVEVRRGGGCLGRGERLLVSTMAAAKWRSTVASG